jgi:hypothetical protein
MHLSTFLFLIDGGEIVRITGHNTKRTMFEGIKVMCPYFDVDVVAVWTNNGRIVIEVN